jgi:serine/threonine-protein kinase
MPWRAIKRCRSCREIPIDWAGEALVQAVVGGEHAPPSRHRAEVSAQLDEVVLRAMAVDPERRYETARAMREALRAAATASTREQLGDWLRRIASATLARRSAVLASIESDGPRKPKSMPPEPASPDAEPGTLVHAQLSIPGDATPVTRTVVDHAAALALPSVAIVDLPVSVSVAPVVESAERAPSVAPKPPRAAAPKSGVPASCQPPYAVDADGVRHVKPHCLRYLREGHCRHWRCASAPRGDRMGGRRQTRARRARWSGSASRSTPQVCPSSDSPLRTVNY